MATIGQLKAVFSLRFATLDADSDGLTNVQEAALGIKIEYQKISPYSPNNAYCELKADPAGHYGIQQTIRTTPGKTYIIALDCKARSDDNLNLKVSDSEFQICVGNGKSPTNSLLNRIVSFSNFNRSSFDIIRVGTSPRGQNST